MRKKRTVKRRKENWNAFNPSVCLFGFVFSFHALYRWRKMNVASFAWLGRCSSDLAIWEIVHFCDHLAKRRLSIFISLFFSFCFFFFFLNDWKCDERCSYSKKEWNEPYSQRMRSSVFSNVLVASFWPCRSNECGLVKKDLVSFMNLSKSGGRSVRRSA